MNFLWLVGSIGFKLVIFFEFEMPSLVVLNPVVCVVIWAETIFLLGDTENVGTGGFLGGNFT